MNIFFRFEMGQEVTLERRYPHRSRPLAMTSPFLREQCMPVYRKPGEEGTAPWPQKMMVVGRIMEECVGGIQLHYQVRIFPMMNQGFRGGEVGVARDLFRFTEFELIAWADVLATQPPAPAAPDPA